MPWILILQSALFVNWLLECIGGHSITMVLQIWQSKKEKKYQQNDRLFSFSSLLRSSREKDGNFKSSKKRVLESYSHIFFTLEIFLTASKYCDSGLKIYSIIVVVILVVVLVIKLLSNSSAFIKVWRKLTCLIQWKNILEFIKIEYTRMKYILIILYISKSKIVLGQI